MADSLLLSCSLRTSRSMMRQFQAPQTPGTGRYVRQQMGFLHQHTIACGDSGNDKDMLAGANLAIVVGNAQPDMKAWIHEVPAQTICTTAQNSWVKQRSECLHLQPDLSDRYRIYGKCSS